MAESQRRASSSNTSMLRTSGGGVASDLRVAVMRTARMLKAEGGRAAVTAGQYSVLAALQRSDLTVRELAEQERMRPPSMTRLLNALADLDMIERHPSPTDGRQVLVRLTEEGKSALNDARKHRTQWMAQQLAMLTPDERKTMAAAAKIMLRMSKP